MEQAPVALTNFPPNFNIDQNRFIRILSASGFHIHIISNHSVQRVGTKFKRMVYAFKIIVSIVTGLSY